MENANLKYKINIVKGEKCTGSYIINANLKYKINIVKT